MKLYIFEFFLLCLASFRLMRLLVFDKITSLLREPFIKETEEVLADGTVEVFSEAKGAFIRKWIGEILLCHWCCGIWCSMILYYGYVFMPIIFYPVILILAIAGVAALVQLIANKLTD